MVPEKINREILDTILNYVSYKNPGLSLGYYQKHELSLSGLGYRVETSEGELLIPWAALRDFESREYIEEYTDYMALSFQPKN